MNISTEDYIADAVHRSYLWVLCAVGVPANILAIIIILSIQAMTPATLLIASLSFFDGSALVSKLVFLQLSLNQVRSVAICKLSFVSVFFSTMANWTLMYICLERFIAVCYPLKKMYLVTMSRCVVLLAVTSAAFLGYLLPVHVIMNSYAPKIRRCVYVKPYGTFMKSYHLWINETYILLLPYVTMVGLTVIIVVKLKFYAKRRRKMLQMSDSSDTNSNKKVIKANELSERALTLMLTFTAIFFLLFTLPSFLNAIYFAYTNNRIYQQLKFLLFDSTHALNFFMYFLAAARFRRRCYRLLCCGKPGRFRNRGKATKSDETGEEMFPSSQLTNIN